MYRDYTTLMGGGMLARLAGLVGVFLALALPAPVLAQQATFKFNPPDGATFVETTKLSLSRQMGTTKESVVEETKTRILFKKAGKGYSVTFTPLSATRTLNGKQVSTTKAEDLKHTTLVYTLDANGMVVTIKGYDAILKQMVDKLPAEQAKTIDLKAQESRMIAARKAEWDAQFAKFAGKTVKTGDIWRTEESLPLMGTQNVKAKKVLKFFLPVKTAGHDCVKIVSSITPDVAALKASMNRSLTGADGKNKAGRVLDLSVTFSGERIIDPATMLIYSETTSNTTRVVFEVPEQGKQTMITTEKKEQRIDYKG